MKNFRRWSSFCLAVVWALVLAACVSTPAAPPNAKVIFGIRWENPITWGFGGIAIETWPIDRGSGVVGGDLAKNGFVFNARKPGPSGVYYHVEDVVAGDYVVAHFLTDRGEHELKWVCPPVGFSVQPNTVTYVGDLVLNGFEFVRFEQAYEAAQINKPAGGGPLAKANLFAPNIDYSKYPNPGMWAWNGLPSSPCRQASGA